ncbi:MAG: GNAT family N-acetyltransferase [Acidiferrobacterales bacterium]
MSNVDYLRFDEITASDFLPLLNSQKIRKHLVEHELFTIDTLTTWMNSKIEVNTVSGCRVRAILCEGELAGWCGIQLEEEKYEIAIVIDDKYWGLGKQVFNDMMVWAKELDHDEIFIHFLHTRPEYKFLKKIAKNVYEADLPGRKFTTYQLTVK